MLQLLMSISREKREELSRIQVSEEWRTQEIIKETEMGEKRFFFSGFVCSFSGYVCMLVSVILFSYI